MRLTTLIFMWYLEYNKLEGVAMFTSLLAVVIIISISVIVLLVDSAFSHTANKVISR